MASINTCTLVGRATKDVEVSKTNSGLSVAQFTIACDRRGSDEADFINCVAWRQSADFLGQYCRKGMLVGVVGRIQTRNYERDGRKVYVTEVVADSVQILESKKSEQPSQPKQEAPKHEDFKVSSIEINADDLPF